MLAIRDALNDNVGMWIDHERAIIVLGSESRIRTKALESHVGAHPRYSSQQDGGGEKKYEVRHDGFPTYSSGATVVLHDWLPGHVDYSARLRRIPRVRPSH